MFGAPGSIVAGGSPTGLAPMSLPKSVVRIGEQGVWSAFQYADTTPMANRNDLLFAAPLNSTGQGFGRALSIAETNQREASKIPGGYAFTVHALALQAYYEDGYPIVRADLATVVNHCVPSWKFLQVEIEISPASLIGAGGGIYGTTADTGAAEGGLGGSRIALNNGNGQVWVYRAHPVSLPSQATFNIALSWGSAAPAIQGGSNNSAMTVRMIMLGTFESAIPVG